MGNHFKANLCKCLDVDAPADVQIPSENKEKNEFVVSQKFRVLSNRANLHEQVYSALRSFEPKDSLLTENDLRLSKTEEEISRTVQLTNPIGNFFEEECKMTLPSIGSNPQETVKLSSSDKFFNYKIPSNMRNISPLEVIKENTVGSNLFNSECASSNTQISKIKINKSSFNHEKESHITKTSSEKETQVIKEEKETVSNITYNNESKEQEIMKNFIHNLLKSKFDEPLLNGEFYKLVIDEKAKHINAKNAFSYSKKFCVLTRKYFSYFNTKEAYLNSSKSKFTCELRLISEADKMEDKFFNESFAKKFKIKPVYNNGKNNISHFYLKLNQENQSEEVLIFASERTQDVDLWVNVLRFLNSNNV